MLAVEVGEPGKQAFAQFSIVPMQGLPPSFAREQYKHARYLAQTTGLRYYFVVSTDSIKGWQIGQPQPFLEAATVDVLGPYTEKPSDISRARDRYLATLVDAWLADLVTHWHSQGVAAPCEPELARAGFLGDLRAARGPVAGQR